MEKSTKIIERLGHKNCNRRANMAASWRQRNLRNRWHVRQYKMTTWVWQGRLSRHQPMNWHDFIRASGNRDAQGRSQSVKSSRSVEWTYDRELHQRWPSANKRQIYRAEGNSGGVIDQNISILIDICTIISYRNKLKHLLDQLQHQHNSYCTIIIYPFFSRTHNPCSLHLPPVSIICFSFCSWKSAHRQFAGYIFWILPVSLENSGLMHTGSRVISLSLLACVLLWNVVFGSDRVVGDSSYCEIVQCETPCRRSIVQCEHSSDWMLPQIVTHCENNSDPTSLKIVQCELGISLSFWLWSSELQILNWETKECHCCPQVASLWSHRWRLCCSGFSSEIKPLTPETTESV